MSFAQTERSLQKAMFSDIQMWLAHHTELVNMWVFNYFLWWQPISFHLHLTTIKGGAHAFREKSEQGFNYEDVVVIMITKWWILGLYATDHSPNISEGQPSNLDASGRWRRMSLRLLTSPLENWILHFIWYMLHRNYAFSSSWCFILRHQCKFDVTRARIWQW